MRKSVTKIVKAVLGFTMAIGAGVGAAMSGSEANPVFAADSGLNASDGVFIIDFYDSTKLTSTSGTGLTNNNYQSFVKVANGLTKANVVTGVSVTGTVQYGKNGGLTAGTGTAASADSHYVTFTIGDDYAVNKCTVYAAAYESGRWKLNNNAAGSGSLGSKGALFSAVSNPFVWNNLDGITSLTFKKDDGSGGNQKRLTIYTIVCEYSAGDPSLTATTTHVSAAEDKTRLDISLNPADTVQLSASVKYNDGANTVSNPEITWSGNDDAVATINQSGLVTAVAKGVARFSAIYAGDSTYNGSFGFVDIMVFDSREVIFNFADIAEANSWENSVAYTSFTFEGVGITATGGGNNGKYYTSNHSWRMYNGGSITITPPSGKSITAVSSVPSRTFSIANDGSSASVSITTNTEFTSITVTLGDEKVLDSISASITDTSRVWRTNDVVSPSDLTIVPHYSDGSDGDEISDGTGVTVTNGTLTIAGSNTINVSYGGKATTVTVSALSSTVVAWTITGSIGNTVKSTAYNLEGLTLHAWYDNGKTDEASSAVANLYEMVASPDFAGATPDAENVIDVKVYLKSDTGHANCLETFSNVSAPIINAQKGTIGNPYTVPEAREAINGLAQNETIVGAYVEGIISQVDSYNSTYKSITYWISEDGSDNNKLEVYSGKGIGGADFTSVDNVEFGARVVVTGTLKKFNSVHEFDKNNELVSYDAPSANDKLDIYFGQSVSIKMIHGNETMTQSDSSESIVFSTLGLSNDTKYADPFDGGNFTITFGGGANDGKYYTTGSGIRTYGDGYFTISSADRISKVEFTWDSSNKPNSEDVADVGTFDPTTSTWTGSEKEITFTRPTGSGHWRLKSVTVYYWEFESVDTVALRLGASIPVSAWEAVNNDANFEITDYGVMIFRTDESHISSAPSVEAAYNANPANVAISRKNSSVPPTAENGAYSFVTKINITSTSNYGMYFCARAFVVINGTDYYFIGDEMQETVRTVASHNNGSNLSSGALAYLAGN